MNTYFPTQARSNTCHLMVDIETLATHVSAPILAIGAVLFDPTLRTDYKTLHAESFLALIDPADAVNTCGPVDGGTLKWWFQQSDDAIKRLISSEALSVREALTRLWTYSRSHHQVPTHIWAKGPDFDCSILQSACKATNVRYPFAFYKQRDVRTAVDLAYPNGDAPVPQGGIKHDARDDAVHQALVVQSCYAVLKRGVDAPSETQMRNL